MADISTDIAAWSATAGSNSPSGGTNIGTGLDDNLRALQAAVVLALNAKGSDIASASTVDLSATNGLFHDITGTTTITAFGTVRAGVWKVLKFEGALTLTHNATSLILLTGANRTTVAGDVGMYVSEGSGNWRECFYMPVNTQLTNSGIKFPASQAASSDVNTLDDYEEGPWTPVLTFATAGDVNVAYTTQVGTYRKIGGMVTVQYTILTSAFTHTTAAGLARITGLPFASISTTGSETYGSMAFGGITKENYTNFTTSLGTNAQFFNITASGSAQAADPVTTANMPTGGTVLLHGTHTYFAA